VIIRGGSGNDKLTLADTYAGNDLTWNGYSGVSQATLDGGDGNDEISIAGALQATLTGGAGVDTFKLMAQQYKTLLIGPKVITISTGTVAVTADPLTITDFVAGAAGDVLDYSDLLKNAATNYDGSNPFATKYLTLVQSGADTLLKFDSDRSAGTAASAITLVFLKNVTATALVNSNFNPNFVLPSALDTTPPTIAIGSDRSTLAVGQTATLSFQISESVADFVVGDLTVSGGALSNFSGSGASYSATFTPNSNSTVNGVVSIASSKFSDAAGNFNADGSDRNNTVTIAVDTVVPTIAISTSKTSLIGGQTATLTFTTSEATTDFVLTDVTASGGTIGSFSGSGSSYSAIFTPNSSSTANGVVSIASSKFSDVAGNFNTDGSEVNNTVTMAVDTAAPVVSSFNPADGATSVSSVSNLVLTVNEAIARGVGTAQLRVGSASGTLVESFDAATSARISLSGTAWTVDPTMDLLPSTQYFLTLTSGSVLDTVGNGFAGTSTYDFTTGAIAPISSGSYGGHSYEVYSQRYSWTDAAAFAKSKGGYLASITSLTENNFIVGIKPLTLPAWIGLYQSSFTSEPAGGWVWDSGEVSTYRAWTSGQPDNSGNIEHYAHYWVNPASPGAGAVLWNDISLNGA
jgi:hypothetical protein